MMQVVEFQKVTPINLIRVANSQVITLSLEGYHPINVATPLWVKCEDEIHTPKSGNLESSDTPEILELKFRGQNILR
jgi:hypothetical protein